MSSVTLQLAGLGVVCKGLRPASGIGRLELDLASTSSHQARMWFNKVEAVVHLVGVLGVAVLCALSVWLTLADVHM